MTTVPAPARGVIAFKLIVTQHGSPSPKRRRAAFIAHARKQPHKRGMEHASIDGAIVKLLKHNITVGIMTKMRHAQALFPIEHLFVEAQPLVRAVALCPETIDFPIKAFALIGEAAYQAIRVRSP